MERQMRGVASLLIVFALAAAAVEQTSKSIEIPDHGRLEFSYPKAWEYSTMGNLKISGTITLQYAQGQKFMVQITPIPSKDGKPESMDMLKHIAETRGEHDLQSSREKKLDLKELKGASARGYYYSLTDKAADPGDYKLMTAAIVGVGDLILNVTILDNDAAKPQRQQALEMLKGTKLVGAATQPAKAGAKQLRIAAPNGKFELVMDQHDLQMLDEQNRGNSKSIMAANEDAWAVSVFLEPAARTGDARAVRAFYEERMKRSPLKREELTMGGDAKKAITEYVIKDLEQKNVNVYMVQDGVWIDVHISKTEFEEADKKMMVDWVGSIHVEPVKK